MDEQKLTSAIASINTWWRGLPISKRIKKSDKKRKVFYDLAKTCIKNDKITSISGPRQVGKTTLMGQLIEHQIVEDKVDPKRIIYIPADNELISLYSDNILVDCIKIFSESFIGESLEQLNSKVYVYIDEVQSMDNWAKQLKSYQDTYENFKFIISGSSHSKLYNDASESLVGRIEFRLVLPFKFREFLEFNMDEEKMSRPLQFSNVDLREGIKESIKSKNPTALFNKVKDLHTNITSEIPQIKKILNMYLIKGGYPGILEYGENYDKSLERLKTDLELTVYKDIHKIFKTRNSSELMSLLTLLASSCGQKINHSRLADSLSIDRRIVANYVSYMKLLYLVQESPFYRNNKFKQIEKMGKAYLLDVGHRNALLGRMNEDLLTESEIGFVIQSVVFSHSTRLKFYLTNHTDYEIYYWEDADSEVDIIFDLPVFVLPMEVKSKSADKGLKAIYRFIEQHKKSSWGIIITKEEFKIERNVLFLPLWSFLLMC